MKNIITLCLILFATFCFSQTAEYGKLTKNNQSFQKYIAKNGDVIQVGDTLFIGTAKDDHGFGYIGQNNVRMHPTHKGKPFTIHKIKSYLTKDKNKFILWITFKGYGLTPVEAAYEEAIEHGEIINPRGTITRMQALNTLKEQKELLDLDLITQEEYDKVRSEMTKYIKQ